MSINNRYLDKITKKSPKSSNWMVKMVSSYSVFLLVILVLFFFLYQSELKNVSQLYEYQQKSSISSTVKLFEKDLDIIDIYCRQLAQNDNFRKLAAKRTTNDSFISLGKAIQKQLNRDSYIETLLPVDEIYCYFPNSQYILSSNKLTSYESFYNKTHGYNSENIDSWLEIISTKDYVNQFVSMDKFTTDSDKHYYMYVVDVNEFYFLNVTAYACFVFSEDDISAKFNNINSENDLNILMITNSTDKMNLILERIEDFSSVEMITRLKSNTFFQYSYNGIAYTIESQHSEITDYTYYYSFPSFNDSSNNNSHKNMYLVFVIFAFLAGGFLIFNFSKRNVAPIIELGQELSEAVEVQTMLQMVVENQKPIICNSYVRRLLSGTVTEEEISYIKDYLGLDDDHLYYNGLYVYVYNNSKDSAEVENFDKIVERSLAEYLHFKKPIYSFNPSERAYAIFLSCSEEDEKEFILTVSDAIVKLHNHLLDNYGIWLFAGMGKNTNNLMSVWESYQQAVEAVSYTSKNYIFFPYEFIKKDSSIFYYPPEVSTKLIHFITTGNKPQVIELFSMIHQENIEERSLPINLVKFLLSDIRNTLLKARFALPSSTPTDITKSLDERFNEHASFKLCEDIALTLCDLFSVKSDDSDLITAIEKYIDANFSDPAMGLNKISDEFEISESYFSHMFKEKTGVNFSTYLENKRMEEATKLIKETDISLNELYISVGYNNANTFRRAFKKIYGVTPSSMRDNK